MTFLFSRDQLRKLFLQVVCTFIIVAAMVAPDDDSILIDQNVAWNTVDGVFFTHSAVIRMHIGFNMAPHTCRILADCISPVRLLKIPGNTYNFQAAGMKSFIILFY